MFIDKNKHTKGGKDAYNHREDPFDKNRLFPYNSISIEKYVPIPEHHLQYQPFKQGMGQPFEPPRAQLTGSFIPTGLANPSGLANNQIFANSFPTLA